MTEKLLIVFKGPLEDEDIQYFKKENSNYSISKSLTGDEIISALIVISPMQIFQIGQIIVKLLERKRFIKIKYGDIEIKNIRPEDVINVLEQLSKKKNS